MTSSDTIITLNIGRDAFVNNVDPDQTPQNAASDQGLHCLPYIQQYIRTHQAVEE